MAHDFTLDKTILIKRSLKSESLFTVSFTRIFLPYFGFITEIELFHQNSLFWLNYITVIKVPTTWTVLILFQNPEKLFNIRFEFTFYIHS